MHGYNYNTSLAPNHENLITHHIHNQVSRIHQLKIYIVKIHTIHLEHRR